MLVICARICTCGWVWGVACMLASERPLLPLTREQFVLIQHYLGHKTLVLGSRRSAIGMEGGTSSSAKGGKLLALIGDEVTIHFNK